MFARGRLKAAVRSRTVRLVAVAASLAVLLSLFTRVPDEFRSGLPGPSFIPGQAAVGTPKQRTHPVMARPHLVPSSVTAADRAAPASRRVPPPPREGSAGTARPPRPPKGTVPPERFNVPRSSKHSGLRPPPMPGSGAGSSRPVAPPHHRPTIVGFNPATSKLLPPSAGGAYARVYQNADGTKTAHVYQSPINFRLPDGTWAPINTALSRAAGQGSHWQVTADSVPARFAPAGTADDLAMLGFGNGESVRFGVAGAAPATGVVSGSTITYPAILPSADLSLTALAGGGAKEDIILHSASAPTTWTFLLNLRGLAPSVRASGRVVFTNRRGKVVAWSPHAFMTDSANLGGRSGVGAYSGKVTYQLSRDSGGAWVLTMTLDKTWLEDPARVFPVTVDPTLVPWNFNDTADTFVQTGYGAQNTANVLHIGTWDNGSDYAATYLDFSSLSSELSNDTIYGATLYLDEIYSFSCTAEPVGVYKVTQSWPDTVTGYPGPSYDSTALGTASFAWGYDSTCGAGTGKWESIDLGSAGTSLVQGWANGGNNYGLTVRAPTSGQVDCSHNTDPVVDCGWKFFDSDNAAGGFNAPYLAVTYVPYNAQYAFTSQSPTVTPAVTNNEAGYVSVRVTNLGHDTWTPTNGYELTYEAYYRNSNGSNGAQVPVTPAQTDMPQDMPAGGSTAIVKAKINPLPPGKYNIWFDMIYVTSNGYALFSDYGVARTAELALDVASIPPNLNAMYPQNNYQVDTLTPQLFADGTSVDDWPTSTVQYWFTLCAGPFGNWTWCTSSPWQTSRLWQIPAGKLAWNTDYYWTVFASDAGGDGSQASTAGPWYLLETAVQQPVITSHLASGTAAGGTLDPVMGNYSTTATDASVATAGPALAISRTYNSLDPRTAGMFGAGWSTLYDMAVTPDGGGTGSVVVTMPDGSQVRFAQNSDGSYSPQQGMFATLVSTSGGGWQLMDKSSTSYVFNNEGQLTSITDNRGRTETLAYNSSEQLATITSASGRALHLTWGSGGYVASVSTDSVNGSLLIWTYFYSGNNLTKVCSPAQAPNCTTYAYTAGSHLGSTVADSGPVAFWPLGDTSGTTATSAIGANLGADDGTYISNFTLGSDAGPGAGSGATAASFGGGSGRVYLPKYSLSEIGPFVTAEAWFKTTGDGVILAYQDAFISDTPSHYTPVLYVGTDGKLYAQFWNGTQAPIASSQVVNDGKWHQAILSGDGTKQTLYLDGQKTGTPITSGTISGPFQDQTYIADGYIGNGSGDWPSTPSGGGTFAFTGDIADVALYDTPLGPAAASVQYHAAQQAQGLSQITLPSGRVAAKLTYNTAADRVATETDADGGTWTLGGLTYGGTAGNATATVKLTDPRGGKTTSVYAPLRGFQITSQTDQAGGTTTWAYNSQGFVDSVVDPNGNPTNYYVDARGNITGKATERTSGTWHTSWYDYYLSTSNPLDPRNDQMVTYLDGRSASALDGTYETQWGYDSYGDLTSEQFPATPGFPSGRTASWTYTAGTEPAVGGGTEPAGLIATRTDPAGRVTSYAYDSAGDLMTQTDPNGLVTTYTYDSLGRKTSMTVTSSAYPNGVTTTYTYDPLGQMLTQTGPAVANQVTGQTHTQKVTWTYDGDGNVLTTSISDLTGGDAARTTTDTYNSNGELATSKDPTGAVTSYTYDAAGNIATQTDPDGNAYAFTYTPTNLVATRTLQNWTGNPFNPSPATNLVLDSYSYDPGGQLASTTDSMGRTTSYTYFMDDLTASVTATGADLNGSSTPVNVTLHSYTYDGAGNQTQDAADGGLTTTNQAWDAADRLTSSTLDPSGLDRVTSYTYNADGDVTSVVLTGAGSTGSRETDYAWNAGNFETSQTVKDGSTSLVTSYTVDQLGHLTSITDPRGNASGGTPSAYTTTMTYDPAGNRQTMTAPPVQVTQNGAAPASAQPSVTFGYDTFGEQTQVQNPLGLVTSYGYDGEGRVTAVTGPSYTPPGGTAITPVSTTTYDGNGNVLSQTDPAGNTWTRVYDQLGDVVRVTDPPVGGVAGQWNYSYDPDGELFAAVGPTGAQTQATYDDLGRQVTYTQVERYPSNASYTTTMAYDTAGNMTSSTDPLGDKTTWAYDAANEITKVTDPLGHASTYAYDGYGDVATATNPLGDTTTYGYDQAGRTTSQAQANSSGTVLASTSFGYDPAGNSTSVTNPDNNATSYAYDALNRVSSVTTPITSSASEVVTYGYDAAGNRTMVTDGNGNPTVTTFNSLGLPESVILPSTSAYPGAASRTFTTSYDADGRAVSQTAPGGISQTWAYDALGDLTGQTGSGAAAATASRTLGYDLAGRLTSYSSPGGTVSIGYDDRGMPTSVTGAGQPAQSYGYNGNGQLTSRADATGTAAFGYNAAGLLATMTDPVTGAALSYGYDKARELTSVSYGTSADSRALAYDALGRVTSDTLKTSGGATIASAGYTYDPAGYLTAETTTGIAGAGTSSYGYDQAGWLTSWKNPSGTTSSYGYDNAGNLTSAGAATYAYNQRDQLTSSTATAGTTTYSYTPSGTLSQASGPSGSASYASDAYGDLVTAGAVSYGYDALGRLAQRTDSAGTTSLAYDGTSALAPAALLSSSGAVTQAYSRDPAGGLVAVATGGTGALAWASPVHGDVTALFSPTGTTLAASAAYDPWGNVSAAAGTMPAAGYQGGYTDPATGLVDMGARWYDPGTAGFTSADTLLTANAPGAGTPATTGNPLAGGGPGPYGYAADNPLTVTDPTGHGGPTAVLDAPVDWAAWEASFTEGGSVLGPVGAGVGAIAGIVAYGMVSDGPSSLLGGCSCGNIPSGLGNVNWSDVASLQGTNWSGLPDLSGLSGLDFSGLSDVSGLSGLNLSGLDLGGLGGGGGGPVVVICDQACIDARLLTKAENMVVPKPHEKPAITQAQLNEIRLKEERHVKAKIAQETAVKGVAKATSREAKLRDKLSGNGGPPGGGPRKPTDGCFEPEPETNPIGSDKNALPEAGGLANDLGGPLTHQPPGPTTPLIGHYPGPVVYPTPAAAVGVGSLLSAGLALGIAIWVIRQKFKGPSGGGPGCPE